MQNRVYSRLRNTSVFKRLWISSLTVAIIPTVLISVLLMLIFWNNLNLRISDYSSSMNYQLVSDICLLLQQINSDITNLSSTHNTLSLLSNYDYMPLRDRYLTLRAVKADLSNQFSRLDAVSDIILLTNDRRNIIHLYGTDESRFAYDTEKILSFAETLSLSMGGTGYDVFYDPSNYENSGVLIGRRIVNHYTSMIQGYILIQMRESFLSSIYRNWTSKSTASHIFILDSDGRVMSSNHKEFISSLLPSEIVSSMSSDEGVLRNVSGIHGSEHFLCTYCKLDEPSLAAVCLVPRDYLSNDMVSFSLVVLIVGIVLVALSSGAASVIVNSITVPVNELVDRMHMVQNNQLIPGPPDYHQDELAIVNNAFNQTIARLEQSIRDIHQSEQERANLELQALTAQISPHFLTNSLNTIRHLAQMQNVSNVESMVGSLTNILAARLGKRNSLVPLLEEVALLQDYINLQKYRSFNEIVCDISIDRDVEQCLIPVFTLQPLVENSLMHGRLETKIDGRIIVNAYRDHEEVHITVTDNGSGIHPERLAEIRGFQSQPDLSPNHIGVRNVHQRIKLLFGEQYGLSIASEYGAFTKVDITVPYNPLCETRRVAAKEKEHDSNNAC